MKLVTNIEQLSSTPFVSNIGQQQRCSPPVQIIHLNTKKNLATLEIISEKNVAY